MLDTFLVAMGVFFITHAVLYFGELSNKKEVESLQEGPVQVVAGPIQFDKNKIVNWDPFKVKPKPVIEKPKPPPPKKIEPPKPPPKPVDTRPVATNLPLGLFGVILDGANSVAFISKNKNNININPPEPKIAGEQIMPGVKLLEIQLHKVIIDHGGKRQELWEEGYDKSLEKLLGGGAMFVGQANPSQPVQVSANRATNFEITPVGDNIYVTQKEVQKQVKNLSGLLAQVRVQPNFTRSGRSDGFKILHVNRGSFIEALGIKSGDIINKINGNLVDSMQKGYQLFNNLQRETAIDVELTRGGASKTIHFEMRN